MYANDSAGLKAGVADDDGEDEQCTDTQSRAFSAAERARMHATQALTRAEDEPAQAREHMRETLSLLDAIEEAL